MLVTTLARPGYSKDGMVDGLKRNTGWASYTALIFAALAVAVTLIVYLVWDLLPRLTSYGSIEYELSILAALGTAGCLGHLAARAYRNSGGLADVCSLFGVAPTPNVCSRVETSVESASWPLLVALLFGPFSLLLAGLGGWV